MRKLTRLSTTIVGAIVCVALAGISVAQTVYRHVDKDGKVTYSDKPPKQGENASEVVIKQDQNVVPSVKTNGGSAEAGVNKKLEKAAEKRVTSREKLEADLAAARERLANAKAELEAARNPGDEDFRTIQRQVEQPPKNNPNCIKSRRPDGKEIVICPANIPTPEYLERVEKLERAVTLAEENVRSAEEALRRGTD